MGEGAQSLGDWLANDHAPSWALSTWVEDLRHGGAEPVEASPPVSYLSTDSAPPGYAVRRAAWTAPVLLASFAGIAALVAFAGESMGRRYAELLGLLTGVSPAEIAPPGETISIRPFALLLFVLLAVFAAGSRTSRLRFLLEMSGLYASLTLLADVIFVVAEPLGSPGPFSSLGGIVAAILALLTGICAVLTQYELPSGIRVRTEHRRSWAYALVFLGAVGLIAAAALTVPHFTQLPPLIEMTAIIAVGLQLLLFPIGSRWGRPRTLADPAPSVAFLVPAHNEETAVGAMIAALDAAARRYPGPARLYLVDNGSTDRTAPKAERALAACKALTGEVVDCPRPGKAHALNAGLARTTEDIVVRVDADTVVLPSLLDDVAPYFADPRVGGVSGIPLPRDDAPWWLYPVRLMEAYYVGFIRVGYNAIDAVPVLPGSKSVYRGELVRRLGGFAAGFNGEDGDLTVRIGRLGYRVVTDPRIQFFTETPATIAHLKEQRVRWFRGRLYVTARNKSGIVAGQGLRCLLLLPWTALLRCRKALTLPILVAFGAAYAVNPEILPFREIAFVAGVAAGAHLCMIVALLVAKRQLRALPFLPL
jgi:glycosyltransferase involved in cell wall biosynthesis